MRNSIGAAIAGFVYPVLAGEPRLKLKQSAAKVA
jgi:hypothetical protein